MSLAHEFFVLRIDEITHSCDTLMMIERKYDTGIYAKSQSVLLLSTLEEFTFFASKNSQVKTLEILIPRRWFFSQLNMECPYGLLKKYMTIKYRKTQFEISNLLFKNLFLKIINEANKEVPDPDYLRKKISSLLTIFFSGCIFQFA